MSPHFIKEAGSAWVAAGTRFQDSNTLHVAQDLARKHQNPADLLHAVQDFGGHTPA